MNTVILLGLLCFINAQNLQLHTATFTPSHPSEPGISVSNQSPIGEVSTTPNNEWRIIAQGDQTWHLLTSLSNQWGFHPTKPSTITFEISSPTSYTNDLAIGFTVPSTNKYIGLRLRLGSSSNRIVPETDGTCPQFGSTPLENGNVVSLVQAGGSSGTRAGHLGLWFGQYDDTVYKSGSTEQFPIKLTLENTPGSHLGLTISYGGANGISEYCQYAPMTSNAGLLMYFSTNDNGNAIDIASISVTYSYYDTDPPTVALTTSQPTIAPTNEPSNEPTSTPTINPTNNPTISPTEYPTEIPSSSPTNVPSKSPSHEPTIVPSASPSVIPSISPSLSPTNRPTISSVITSFVHIYSLFYQMNFKFYKPSYTPSPIQMIKGVF